MKRRYRLLRVVVIIVASLTVALVVGGFIASRYVKGKFDAALTASGIKISSLRINLFTRSITVQDFEWTVKQDSVTGYPHTLSFKTIYAGGISVYQLVRFKKITMDRLDVEDGKINYNSAIKQQKDSTSAKPIPIKGISINNLSLRNIAVKISNDSLQEHSGMIDLSLSRFELDDISKASDPIAYKLKSFETSITALTMDAKKSMYKYHLGKIHASSINKEITIDSLVLLPKYSKYKFSRIGGRQVDRLVLRVPEIKVIGFNFDDVKDSLFVATSMEVHRANVHIYRDKRLPFIKDHNMPLPIAMIRSLPFELAIDSIKIKDSKIVYEEFPERGFKTGAIVFENLNATLDHISNRNFYPNYKQATLFATSKLMKTGVIKAEFSLPYGKDQVYNAKGTVSNLAMRRLNPMLENLAFISIESGRLNQLDFNFNYNDLTSEGSILINYENLKLTSLTREKNSDINEFKTWLINMFLKKDKDKEVSKEKRTGIIKYDRDRRKAIFNVWVKSLFSGLKSSVLDSPAKKEPNQTKKEKRDSQKKLEREPAKRNAKEDKKDNARSR